MKNLSQYTWSSTYDLLPFWLIGRKSIWSYVCHIFINSIFLTFLIFYDLYNLFLKTFTSSFSFHLKYSNVFIFYLAILYSTFY
jgi:hypothetical protein